MNKIFANESKAIFEDDNNATEAFDEVFKKIYDQENEIKSDKLVELWTEVEQSEKTIAKNINVLLKKEVLQSSIGSELKKLKEAEDYLDASNKRQLDMVKQHKDKQSKILSSLDHVESLIRVVDANVENDQKTLDDILRSYENELREVKNLILAKKECFFLSCILKL